MKKTTLCDTQNDIVSSYIIRLIAGTLLIKPVRRNERTTVIVPISINLANPDISKASFLPDCWENRAIKKMENKAVPHDEK